MSFRTLNILAILFLFWCAYKCNVDTEAANECRRRCYPANWAERVDSAGHCLCDESRKWYE